MITVRDKSASVSGPSASNTHCQPCSHSAISSARLCARSSNSWSRMRVGFSPSEVRKSTHRDRMLPAMCRMITATLLDSLSMVTCSCSSESCSMALSASFLIFLNSSTTQPRMCESVAMFDYQERDRHGGQAPRRAGDVAAASDDGVQGRVQDEPPQNTLRDRKGQRNQDQRR